MTLRRTIKPGDIVRHRGTGDYPEFKEQYGLVQINQKFGEGDKIPLGVEWDEIPFGEGLGDNLSGFLPFPRDICGWYVSPDDVEVL